jgi:DNA-binding transcriptional ArsR family regulator
MAGRKLRELESREVQNHIIRLHNYGYDQDQIASKLEKITGHSVTQQTVSYHLKKIRNRLSESFAEERDILADQALSQLRQVRKEAYEAYRKTLRPLRKQVLSPDGEVIELINERDPSSQFLNIVRETVIDEIKLKGLNEPDRLKLESQVQVLDWTKLLTPTSHPASAPTAIGPPTTGISEAAREAKIEVGGGGNTAPGGVIGLDGDMVDGREGLVTDSLPPGSVGTTVTGPPPDLDEVEYYLSI